MIPHALSVSRACVLHPALRWEVGNHRRPGGQFLARAPQVDYTPFKKLSSLLSAPLLKVQLVV